MKTTKVNGKELLKRLGIENQKIITKGGSDFDLETILNRILQVNEPRVGQTKDFESSARPMMKYLCENHHPHVSVIITSTHAELLEGLKSTGEVLDYVLD